MCALSPALPAVISRGASRREARGWVVASRECAPRHADRGPSGAASSTPRPRSSTASTGSAVNRTAADRCAPCADTHRVLHAPRHGDAGHSRHCECDLTRALRGARGRDPRLSLRARFCSPYLFLAPFSIKNKNIKNSKSSLRRVKFLHKPNPKFGFGPIAVLVQLRAMLRAKLGADRSTFRATL